jgi:hypothetical protein
MRGEGEAALLLGPVWLLEVGTRRGNAPADLEGKTPDPGQGRQGAVIVIGRPHGVATEWAVAEHGVECLGCGWLWPRGSPCHWASLHA